jgi:hypothetical protein
METVGSTQISKKGSKAIKQSNNIPSASSKNGSGTNSMETEQLAPPPRITKIQRTDLPSNSSKNGDGTSSMETEKLAPPQWMTKRQRTENTDVMNSPLTTALSSSTRVPVNARLAMSNSQNPRPHQQHAHMASNQGSDWPRRNGYRHNAQHERHYETQTVQRTVYADIPQARTNNGGGRRGRDRDHPQY